MSILVPKLIYNQIITYGRISLPNEMCGALLGMQISHAMVMKEFIPLSNSSIHQCSKFEIDRREWTNLIFDALKRDRQIMGLVHSHPTTPAVPSSSDLQTLWYTIPTQWIVSYKSTKKPVLKAFRYHADGTTYEHCNWTLQA
jgi:proteasome lid subunit RPN8/RPN11